MNEAPVQMEFIENVEGSSKGVPIIFFLNASFKFWLFVLNVNNSVVLICGFVFFLIISKEGKKMQNFKVINSH